MDASSSTITLSPPPPPAPGQYARNHRRSRSSTHFFTDERTAGAFTPLPTLPRRQSSMARFRPPTPLPAVQGENIEPDNALGLGLDMGLGQGEGQPTPPPSAIEPSCVPFPSIGSSGGPASPDVREAPPRPAPPLVAPVPRRDFPPTATAAAAVPQPSATPTPPHSPITLKNGRPLKPSLKSRSHSSPHLSSLPSHTRAVSAPASPSSYVPKNVHFAGEKEGLEHVVLFLREQRPIAVSNGTPEETETETETESGGGVKGYPFPRMDAPTPQPTAAAARERVLLDSARTSPVPNPATLSLRPHQARDPVLLESLLLPQSSPLVLRGTVLVRNVAFHKHVAVRFTLDDWQTISEVSASYINHLPALPPPFAQSSPFSPAPAAREEEWDRFGFQVRLEDYERKIEERTLFLVVRYAAEGREWWDNNAGANYRVRFTRAPASAPNTPSSAPSGAQPLPAPAPPPPPPTQSGPVRAPPEPLHADLPKRSSSLGQLNNLKLFNYAPPTTSPKYAAPASLREVLARDAVREREREERREGLSRSAREVLARDAAREDRRDAEEAEREKGGRLASAAGVEKFSSSSGANRRTNALSLGLGLGGMGGGAEFEAHAAAAASASEAAHPLRGPAPAARSPLPSPSLTAPQPPMPMPRSREGSLTPTPTPVHSKPIPIPPSAIGEVRRRALRAGSGSGSGSSSSSSSSDESPPPKPVSRATHRSPPPSLPSLPQFAPLGSPGAGLGFVGQTFEPTSPTALAQQPTSTGAGAGAVVGQKKKLFTTDPITPPSSSSEPSPTHSGPSSPLMSPRVAGGPGMGPDRGEGGAKLDRSERSYEEFLERYCFFRGVGGLGGGGEKVRT